MPTHRHIFLWVNLSKVRGDGTLRGEVGLGEAVEALEWEKSQMVTGQVELQLIFVLEGLLAIGATELSHNAG